MAPKRKSSYSTNDNFTVSDDDQNGSSDIRTKRTKTGEIKSSHFSTASSLPKRDDDNSLYWEISKARRVTIQDYNKKKMVSIREYYEKDGKMFPGKKGISMTLEQYAELVSVLPSIENELRKSGIKDVPRPNYDTNIGTSATKEKVGDETDEEADASGEGRANHEATSDEEE